MEASENVEVRLLDPPSQLLQRNQTKRDGGHHLAVRVKRDGGSWRKALSNIFDRKDEARVKVNNSFLGGVSSDIPQDVPKAASHKLGTVMGVFVPCLQNILGIIYFVRLSWIVGVMGVGYALVVVCLCCATTFITSLSLSAIATNGAIKGGGPYYLISRALGPEFGGSVGVCFYLGTTVAGAMYILGTIEMLAMSFPDTFKICSLDGPKVGDDLPYWTMRVYGLGLLVLCALAVNGGVKYISKFSPYFLYFVIVSILCILMGIFLAGTGREYNFSPDNSCLSPNQTRDDFNLPGVTGFSGATLSKNWGPPDPLYTSEFNPTNGFNCTSSSPSPILFPPSAPPFPPLSPLTGTPPPAAPPEPPPRKRCNRGGDEYSLSYALSLFFPSVTGIMAGSNRSGDLKDAQTSIPRGTIAATTSTSILYILTALFWGMIAERELALYPYYDLPAVIAWPHEMIVRIGVVMSSLGAALQSLVGAPRLLQAIANDSLMPILTRFGGKGEPRLALLLTTCICALCVATGRLEAIAPIITMFFLMCYLSVNVACLMQDVLQEPNWRPRFQYYHPVTAVIGIALCVFIMVYTEPLFALGSIVIVALLYSYISYKKVESQWGDGTVGLRYERARTSLMELEKISETHAKNWRPQILLMCKMDLEDAGLPISQRGALKFLKQLKGGRGLCILGSVVPGVLSQSATLRKKVENSLREQRDAAKVRGFTQVIMCSNVDQGFTSLIQTAGLGGLAPNTVMVNWSTHDEMNEAHSARMSKLFNEVHAYNLALIVLKGAEKVPEPTDRLSGFVDVWWVVHDGGLQLLLSTILRKSRVWSNCSLRVFCVLQAGEDPDALHKKVVDFLYKMRIDATVKCVVLTTDPSSLNRHRAENKAWEMNAAIVGSPIGNMLVGSGVANDDVDDPRNEGGYSEALHYTSPVAVRPNAKRTESFRVHVRPSLSSEMNNDVDLEEEFAILDSLQLPSEISLSWRETFAATKQLNQLFLTHSSEAELLITNLPMPGISSDESPDQMISSIPYAIQLNMLTHNVPLCLLVAGQKGSSVVTMYS
ncbi:hypothetical protein AB1Y20_021853 [Prymnesium parvum]|uniref:Solute carrier family 12 member 6 n=1 Tax=Prymnesium parvum TaxID=97485 RepID=A0AB34JJV9_PRYPA